jgi:PAS domain S-box-containing protein
MGSTLDILGLALFLSAVDLLLEVSFILLFMGALIWIVAVIKLANRLSLKFLSGQTYKTKKILKGLGARLESQELTIQQAERELEKMGNNSLEVTGTVLEGPLGVAVTTLRNKLDTLRKQESKQNWVAHGVAIISGIRKTETQIEHYTFSVISALAKYLGANQAIFFILENQSLKLSATYAYDKRKYGHGITEISSENGLLGQCITEKELMHLTQIPRNYVKITSGLGEATPKCLVLIPLLYRDQVYGVIEIASLKDFEPHHLEFIQKSSEEIASELAALQIQTHTKELLKQAQAQTLQLSSHEEELKQNMEEMQATQEEMRRKEVALQEKLDEIEAERAKNVAILETCMDAVVSFNTDGTVEFCNRAGEEMLGYSRYELANHSIFEILNLHLSFRGEEPVLLSKTGGQITTRSEVNATDRNGDEISLLLTATHINVKGKSMFTLFAQKISVDLF